MYEIPKPGPPPARGRTTETELADVRRTLNAIREAMFTVGIDQGEAYVKVREILADNWGHADSPGRVFDLIRRVDKSNVSGTGRVAEGFEFQDGRVALRWLGRGASTNLYDSIDDVKFKHGYGGATQVVYR